MALLDVCGGNFEFKKVAMMDYEVFMVRFKTKEEKDKPLAAGPIMYDRKPLIVKS